MRRKITLQIEKLAYGGEGLGRYEGRVCFVSGALPGETVEAEIEQDKKKFLRARMSRLIEPSPARREPPCLHWQHCGGCQYQHVSYEEELKWKETQVREYLSRALRIDPELVGPITGSSKEYGYRTSAAVHPVNGKGASLPGFISLDNKTVVPIKECFLLDPALNRIFKTPLESGAVYRLSRDGRIIEAAEEIFFEAAGDGSILTHSRSFFQANPEITASIGQNLRSAAGKIKPDVWIDLYSGAGTFTWLAAPEAKLIFCEENPYGILALKKNLENRGLTAYIMEGPVEKVFPARLQKEARSREMVFLDPPRRGVEPSVARSLGRSSFEQIAYLSCHLGTLTRDLSAILVEGKYKVAGVFPYDMFPKTKHVEILVYLEPLQRP